jgi:hypothetical protein
MSDYLDGPKFVAWLESTNPDFTRDMFGPSTQRRLRSWCQGHAASVWSVDELLTGIGLHISQIPEDAWLPGYPRRVTLRKSRSRVFSTATKEWVIKRLAEGITFQQIANEVGASERTVRRWTQNSREKAAR